MGEEKSKKGMPRYFMSCLLTLMLLAALAFMVCNLKDDVAPTAAAKAAPVRTENSAPTFQAVKDMCGQVVKDEGTDLLGLHWVTFERRGDNKLSVSGYSLQPIMIGMNVCLMTARGSFTPNGMPTETPWVMPVGGR
jgi:hypothetical protein